MTCSPPAREKSERHTASTAPDDLIRAHIPIARSIAARYRNRGLDQEDLEQVAMVGLLKAANRFDAEAGHDFLAFAIPTIRGEVRRHFRDAGWVVRPPRRIQEMQLLLAHAEEELASRLGRSPRPSELAAHLDAPLDDVVEALSADGCFAPTSLNLPVGQGGREMAEMIPAVNSDMQRTEAIMMLRPVLQALSERDRRMLHLRFFEDWNQQDIGAAVGLTQAQVSRVLRRILDDLHSKLARPGAA